MEKPPLPVPLGYAAARQRGRVWAWPYQILLVAAVVVSLFVLLGSLILISRFGAIFRDVKTELPMVMKWLLAFNGWLGSNWGWCVALLLAMAIVVGGIAIDVTAVEVRPIRRYAVTMTIVLLLADALWAALVVVATSASMLTLMQTTSS